MNDLLKIKQKCLDDKIPIIRDNTFDFINRLITNNNYSKILELGTAYGYSAFLFSLNKSVTKIISVEKDKARHLVASNLLNKNQKIELVNNDIFLYEPLSTFDLIFVDGPKSRQQEIVNKYMEYLNESGKMVVDNIYLKKFDNSTNLNKNQEKLIQKVKTFREWLQHSKMNVKILDIDDGIAIISKSN
jgi:predicted O-methyltransferase YrrM